MTQETDLETVLCGHFRVDPEKPVELTMRTNNEGRIVAQIGAVDAVEFVVFGNNVRQYPRPKPPTQRAVVTEGINDGGMGRV